MEDQLEAIRIKIRTLLDDCGCKVIGKVDKLPPVQRNAETVIGQIEAAFRPKSSPDRTVKILLRINTEVSSVHISGQDVSSEIKGHKSFGGDDPIKKLLAFIDEELPKF